MKLQDDRDPIKMDLVERVSDLVGRAPAGAVFLANRWICSLHREAQEAKLPWVDPHISETSEGEILFEWWAGNKRLTVYVSEAEGASFSRFWGERPSVFTDDGAAETHEIQRTLWNWLLSAN